MSHIQAVKVGMFPQGDEKSSLCIPSTPVAQQTIKILQTLYMLLNLVIFKDITKSLLNLANDHRRNFFQFPILKTTHLKQAMFETHLRVLAQRSYKVSARCIFSHPPSISFSISLAKIKIHQSLIYPIFAAQHNTAWPLLHYARMPDILADASLPGVFCGRPNNAKLVTIRGERRIQIRHPPQSCQVWPFRGQKNKFGLF